MLSFTPFIRIMVVLGLALFPAPDRHGTAYASVCPTFERTDYPLRSTARYVTVGDFNGDKIPDIADVGFGRPVSPIAILLGRGDGSFEERRYFEEFSAGIFEEIFAVTTGDFNGDGNLDLAVAVSGLGFIGPPMNGIYVLRGRGDGSLAGSGG